MDQVAKFLNRNTRRRYLFTLILFNDREKSNFDPISEQQESSEDKLSHPSSFDKSEEVKNTDMAKVGKMQSLRNLINKHERAFKDEARRPQRFQSNSAMVMQNQKLQPST